MDLKNIINQFNNLNIFPNNLSINSINNSNENSELFISTLKNYYNISNSIINSFNKKEYQNLNNINFNNLNDIIKIIFENIGNYEKIDLYRSFWFIYIIIYNNISKNNFNLNVFYNIKNFNSKKLSSLLKYNTNIKYYNDETLFNFLKNYYCMRNSVFNENKIEKYILEDCNLWLPNSNNQCQYLKNNPIQSVYSTCTLEILCYKTILCSSEQIIKNNKFENDLNQIIDNIILFYYNISYNIKNKLNKLKIYNLSPFISINKFNNLYQSYSNKNSRSSTSNSFQVYQSYGGSNKKINYNKLENMITKYQGNKSTTNKIIKKIKKL